MATCTTTTAFTSSSSKPIVPSLHVSKRRPISISRFSRRFSISISASATTATWTPAPLSVISPATSDSSVYHVIADLSSLPSLSSSYSAPGQYIQLRVSGSDNKPAFMAIASPPTVEGRFEFLVKRVPGSTADLICGLREGDLVELGPVMGKGFPIERIEGTDAVDSVFIFATGTGISAIRSLIESDFPGNKKADVRLYYGARNLQIMAYQDRFEAWESSGVTIIPVLSQPDDTWIGETGYVQNAFLRTKPTLNPTSTGVVLCGHKQMAEPGPESSGALFLLRGGSLSTRTVRFNINGKSALIRCKGPLCIIKYGPLKLNLTALVESDPPWSRKSAPEDLIPN